MDHMKIHAYKTRSIKKHKGQQLFNDVILYSLTTLACTSFCSSHLWYPPFCATFNVFFFFSLPQIMSVFLTSKALFIVGNLIVIFLLGESKFSVHKSKAYNDVCHLQVISLSQEQKSTKINKNIPKQEMQVKILESKTCEKNDDEEFFELYNDEETCEPNVNQMGESYGHDGEDLSCSGREVKVIEEEKHEGDGDVSLPADELNKLADDFIARIIRQRMFETEFCRG